MIIKARTSRVTRLLLLAFWGVFATFQTASAGDSTANIVVMRHGQSDHNVGRFFSSDPQHPNYIVSHLTENGKTEVRNTARKLLDQGINASNVTKVLVSPLPRTRETAEILIEEGVIPINAVVEDARLTEIGVGEREGTLIGIGEGQWNDNYCHTVKAETRQQITRRATHIVEELKNFMHDGTLIIVTHGFPMREIVHLLSGERSKYKTAEHRVIALN